MNEFIIGIISGVVSSFLVWWILFHFITPLIRFSEKISKQSSSNSTTGWIYRIKFENAGRRGIVDVELYAKLSVRGLNPQRPRNLEITYLPVSFGGRIPLLQPVRFTHRRHLIRVDPNKAEEFKRKIYPNNIQRKAEENKLTLDDLLNLGTESRLEIIAMGYDKFSKAHKVFVSKRYRKQDIVTAPFKKNSLEMSQ